MGLATDAVSLVSIPDLRAAAAVLDGVAVRTPLLALAELGDSLGVPLWVKPEMLQRGGAFKFRGAYNYLAGMEPAHRARGVIAPSSGNHAQAVALAARLFGVPAIVVMPTTVTAPKRTGAERLGARVELAGTTTHDRMERARELAAETGASVVPPYDDVRIIAGQGTVGLEIVDDCPELGTVIVPVGGGGLSAGVATAVKLLSPETWVVAVEPECAPKLTRARESGAPVDIPSLGGLADGLLAVRVGATPFAHHASYVDEVALVPDAALAGAVRHLLDRAKVVTEPSGAITIAALREGIVVPRGPTVAVLSGGNVEWDGLRALLDGEG